MIKINIKRMLLSKEGKNILDNFCASLDVSRPTFLRICFAKGFTNNFPVTYTVSNKKEGWEFSSDLFDSQELTLFYHLLVDKNGEVMTTNEFHEKFLDYIEKGLRIINKNDIERSSLDEIRNVILQ